MQYAEVVPNTKTDLKNQIFTYNIPPEILPNIKVGSLVLIPFGKRKIEGLVIEIKRLKGKIQKEKLKSIANLLTSGPVLDKVHLKLAKWMAEYYFAPLSLCIFEMLALPSKGKDKGYGIKDIGSNKPLFPKSYYLNPILRLCQKVLAKNKQVIILFPEVNLARNFLPHLQSFFGEKKIIFYHGELNKTERYQAWKKIKQEQAVIVLGSRLALFAPLSRLGLIIINDEESEGYKNERAPRYNIKTVAEKLVDLTSCKLVLISSTPSIESSFQAKKRKFYLLKPKSYILNPKSSLIDMKEEIKKGNFSPFSEILQNILIKTINERKKAILFINRRGAASYIFCKDCGYVFKCPNCDTPLTYHLASNQLVCHHCNFKTKPPTVCPACQGFSIKFKGLGTQRIESEVKKMFVRPSILRIEKDYMNLEDMKVEGRNNRPDIVIGTQKLFSYWSKPVNLVAVVSIDSLLNVPDFRQGEKVFSLISKLKSLALDLFLIQTYHPENFVIQTAIKGDFQDFYKNELTNRRKLNFPPFSRLIRLIHQDKNEKKCQKEAELFAEKLKLVIRNSSLDIVLLGPSPCFYPKIRGKFRWQIVINLKSRAPREAWSSNLKSIQQLLKTLPSDWIIDVDPVTLL
jgi:primosomal protein N' (replication factor Y)